MKITDSETIKAGERELIDTIIGDLDWGVIEKIFKEKHQLKIQDDVEYRQGDIIVHNNTVAYKLDFDVKLTLSILLDRSGNYISVTSKDEISGGEPEKDGPDTYISHEKEPEAAIESTTALGETEPRVHAASETQPSEKVTEIASEIADMISEINEE